MRKQATDIGKPCNKVMTNYCYNITQNYKGYLTGIPISYGSDVDFESIQEVLNYNDVHSQDAELLKSALIFGVGYEIAYLDEEGKQRFKVVEPRTVIPVYDNTLNQELAYVIRFYQDDLVENENYLVEVYSNRSVKTYKSTRGFASFNLIKEEPHYFNMVPISVFQLNAEEESIFHQVMSLQDAYNELVSAEVDDFQSFADAYMIMKGVYADEDLLNDAKSKRAFMIDADCDISYLTKNINDTQIENMLQSLNDAIHKISNSPDFNDEKLMAQSGIAMRYKLLGFENASSAIEANMRKAIQKRIELICAVLAIKGGEEAWRDVNIVFTRNLPENTVETAQVVNSLRGLVSDETLLGLLPFVPDVEAELERLKAQKELNLDLYAFPTGNEGEDVSETEE